MSNTQHMANVICPSEKQLKMITALLWALRPYYLYPQWREIEFKLDALLRKATMAICSRTINRMLSALKEKEERHAKKVWIPMNYRFTDPDWRENLARIAAFLFSDEAESFSALAPDDPDSWRELKNRIEREEVKRSYEFVPDEFENDTRAEKDEEERWKRGKPDYSEMIQGIDFLEPVVGIDW